MTMAEGVLISTIEYYLENKRQIPAPSQAQPGERLVSLPANIVAGTAPYMFLKIPEKTVYFAVLGGSPGHSCTQRVTVISLTCSPIVSTRRHLPALV